MRERGYTLIEMIFVVSISAILVVAVIDNLRGAKPKEALKIGTQEFISNIQAAQSMTLAGVANDNAQIEGYGIHLIQGEKSYFIFADKNSNFIYDIGDSIYGDSKNFPPDVVFASATVDIFFRVPDANLYFNGTLAASDLTINLKYKDGKLGENIIITKNGAIGTQ